MLDIRPPRPDLRRAPAWGRCRRVSAPPAGLAAHPDGKHAVAHRQRALAHLPLEADAAGGGIDRDLEDRGAIDGLREPEALAPGQIEREAPFRSEEAGPDAVAELRRVGKGDAPR